MNLILLGAPGAGKGTQAVMIAKRYHIPHISTGEIFRKNIKESTELGILAKSFIDKGQLVSDEVVIAIVKDRLLQKDCKNGYILDGFPRTVLQAEALEKIAKIDFVLNLEIEFSLLEERLTGRRVCGDCGASYHIDTLEGRKTCKKCCGALYQRDDDKTATVKARMDVYDEQTKPLIQYYSSAGKIINIDASNSVEKIFGDISTFLDKQL